MPIMDEWSGWYIPTMENYARIKKNKIMNFSDKMKLEIITLSAVNFRSRKTDTTCDPAYANPGFISSCV